MRHLKSILVLLIFIFVTAIFIFSDVLKVRVIVPRANIRLKPDLQSTIISRVPLGGVLDVIKKEGDWYHVKLPPDEKGIVVTGYIHQSTVEVFEEIKKEIIEVPKEERVEEKKQPEVTPPIIKKPPIIKEEKPPAANGFNKGGKYLTLQVGINSWAIPLGVNFEYGLTKNIGIDATTMIWLWSDEFWSNTLIDLSLDAIYHFTEIKVDKLDLYAGGGLGYAIYSWRWKKGYEYFAGGSASSSGIYIRPFFGARYFFSPKTAVHLRLFGTILGSWAGFGSTLGVSFNL